VSMQNPTRSEIVRLREAGEWVQRLNESSDQSVADQWFKWCTSDAQNLQAFEQMQSVWQGFSEARDTALHPYSEAARPKQRIRLFALAASVVLLAGVAGWFAVSSPAIQMFETAVGERRSIALADGSHLDLAPASRISTRFSRLRRDVQLERGQAFFTVAHNATRPFVVEVNGLTVTAVGTAFDVRIDPSATVVTVSEGRINVASEKGAADASPRLQPAIIRAGVGQQVTFSKPTHRFSVATVDPKVAGSWRDGVLQFMGEPLEDVVGEVNRYSTRKIILASALQQTRFTGTVSPENIADWLKALEQIYAIQVLDQDAGEIHIQSRDDHAAR
jgi:transmembrane sensor